MPVTLSLDPVRREAHVVATGKITMAEVRAHLEDERMRGGLPYREFIDASHASAAFDADDVRAIVEILRKLGRKGALGPTGVIASDDVTYGMLRMLEALLADVAALRVFRVGQEKEAERWLATAPIRKGDGSV